MTINQRRVFGLALLVVTLGLVTVSHNVLVCGLEESPFQEKIVQSEKERSVAPDVEQADLDELVAGNSAFAFDLYHAVRESDNNLLYSPYSISVALAMTYAGARGETEQQMADTLHFTLPQDHLHSAFNVLAKVEAQEGEGTKLNMANAIWCQAGYSFLPDFLNILAKNYGAGPKLLDFMNALEDSRVAINKWVSEETEGKLKDLLSSGSISPDTRLILTNALYFKALWLYRFSENLTQDGDFHLLNGDKVTVPMMKQDGDFRYAGGEGYQAIELPYSGEDRSMVILLPEAGTFKEFERSLTAEKFTSITADLNCRYVSLTMPKFMYESTFSLTGTLSDMGMSNAFQSEAANFSGMDGTRSLFIRDVFCKAFVSVDENGTEVATATAVVMSFGAEEPIPITPIKFTIDRPFIFVIRDMETTTIWLMGRVLDPSES